MDNARHLVERKALGRGGEFAGEGEDGEGWGEAHGREMRPKLAYQGPKVGARQVAAMGRGSHPSLCSVLD